MLWIDEVVAAMRALGGAARYSDLYELIHLTTERELTREWKATVRRTIEDHSSDSANFRSDDIFEHVSHGHWKIRGADITESELAEREHLTPSQVITRVFVHEHWRRVPETTPEFGHRPTAAWCDDGMLRVRLADGREIATPLSWYPFLANATHALRNAVDLTVTGVHWPKFDEDLSVKAMLDGWRPTSGSQTGK